VARQFKCSVCGSTFIYTKRGRAPTNPVCEACKSSPEVQKALIEKTPSGKQHSMPKESEKYSTYYDFSGPSEEEKPFEKGESLYFIPRGIFHSEDSLHRYGKVCKFVRYAEDEKQGRVYVEVRYRRDGKSSLETLWTNKAHLTRFIKVRKSSSKLDESMLS